MAILLLLLPLSVVLVGVAIYWFLWAVDHRQFDDIEQQAIRALVEESDDHCNQTQTREHKP